MDIKDLAGLAAPASKIVEVFAKATGVLYEPTRIRREAEAQADALVVKTNAEIQADDLRRRAVERFITQEIKKQENLEAVRDRTIALVAGQPECPHN